MRSNTLLTYKYKYLYNILFKYKYLFDLMPEIYIYIKYLFININQVSTISNRIVY